MTEVLVFSCMLASIVLFLTFISLPSPLFDLMTIVKARHVRRLFWWYRAIIPFYATLFRIASYPEHIKRRYISFIVRVLAPHFGPTPPEHWSTFANTSYIPSVRTPFEPIMVLGDSDGRGNQPMSVRFSMELIDSANGLPMNPEECLATCRAIARRCDFIEGFDSSWLDVCYDTLVYHEWRNLKADHVPVNFFFGGEFTSTGITTKFYFFPMIRARETGVDGMELVSQCMAHLGVGRQWETVTGFVNAHPEYNIYPEIVGIEGVVPTRNRVKVYLRLHQSHTSLADTVFYATLGGVLKDDGVSDTVKALRMLWKLMFPGVREDEVIQLKRPGTKGILVYFEIGLDRKGVIPKVYIPIYRYCQSDVQIARVITEYYRLTRHGGEVEKNYDGHLRELL
ncbi:hypothetical protein VNI00_010907 [Paramarasmius palmivorus]|uniref:Uncharacterized protein n=1 Tax=Paramarasmius palmivorus TaxID=297713 RepID=A0AAW0CDE1_9AGAR